MIDRDAVWALKKAALERVWAAVRDEPNVEFRAWEVEQGRALQQFAIWSTIAELQDYADWRRWPVELRRPESPAVARIAAEHADRVRSPRTSKRRPWT